MLVLLFIVSAGFFGGFCLCCITHRANFLYREQRVATCYWTSATDFLQHWKERPHALIPSSCMFKSCLPRGYWPQVLLSERLGAGFTAQPELHNELPSIYSACACFLTLLRRCCLCCLCKMITYYTYKYYYINCYSPSADPFC